MVVVAAFVASLLSLLGALIVLLLEIFYVFSPAFRAVKPISIRVMAGFQSAFFFTLALLDLLSCIPYFVIMIERRTLETNINLGNLQVKIKFLLNKIGSRDDFHRVGLCYMDTLTNHYVLHILGHAFK